MRNILSFLLLFASLNSYAVEYLCWQVGEYPGTAFETSVTKCKDGSTQEKGYPAQGLGPSKTVVCSMPAMCLALTPKVIDVLQTNMGKSIEAIKKMDSKDLLLPLANSGFTGRASTVVCEGKGKTALAADRNFALEDVTCPSFTACANAEGLLYNASLMPMRIQTDPNHVYGTSPMKITPSKQSGQK